MRKRKFTSTKFAAKMFTVTGPALLSVTALASPGDARNAAQNAARHAALIPTQRTTTLNPVVSTLIPIVGQVTQANGKPAANAVIYVTWLQSNSGQQFHKCMADKNGKFETTITPANKPNVRVQSAFAVTALLPDKGIAWTQATTANSGLSNLKLQLMPLTTLEGHLIHTDGTPGANESVSVQYLMPRATIRNGVSHTPNAASQTQSEPALLASTTQNVNSSIIMPLFPADALAAHFRAITDSDGKFTLRGVPRDTDIMLKPGSTMAIASGSASPFTIQDQERQSAGVFVACSTARVKVRVIDLLTHQPIPQMRVTLANTDPLQNMVLGRMMQSLDFRSFQTDAKGEMTTPDLLPGEYRISVRGCVKTARVEPGKDIAPVNIAVRQGALKGRLLDADGKPVPNAEVRLAVAGDSNRQVFSLNGNGSMFQQRDFHIGISGGEFFDFQGESVNAGAFNKALPSALVRTDANGVFTIEQMPWGSPNVRVWASKDNDLAEWNGSASKIDANLTLKMRRNTLMTVSGRLIDPERRPLANVTCKALHWLSTPRATWFATARDVKTDAQGNFKVEGMERGESFSLITLGQSQQLRNNVVIQRDVFEVSPAIAQNGVQHALQILGGNLRLVLQVAVRPQDFESPRFLTCASGDGQNLGDVMVHPQDTPDEVMQSYGGSPGDPDTGPLPGVTLAPSTGDTQAAQAALVRFDAALKTGDTAALTELTSHISSGWSSNRQSFLQHVNLCGRMNTDTAEPTTQALKFVPRGAITTLMGMASPEAGAETAWRHRGNVRQLGFPDPANRRQCGTGRCPAPRGQPVARGRQSVV